MLSTTRRRALAALAATTLAAGLVVVGAAPAQALPGSAVTLIRQPDRHLRDHPAVVVNSPLNATWTLPTPSIPARSSSPSRPSPLRRRPDYQRADPHQHRSRRQLRLPGECSRERGRPGVRGDERRRRRRDSARRDRIPFWDNQRHPGIGVHVAHAQPDDRGDRSSSPSRSAPRSPVTPSTSTSMARWSAARMSATARTRTSGTADSPPGRRSR